MHPYDASAHAEHRYTELRRAADRQRLARIAPRRSDSVIEPARTVEGAAVAPLTARAVDHEAAHFPAA